LVNAASFSLNVCVATSYTRSVTLVSIYVERMDFTLDLEYR